MIFESGFMRNPNFGEAVQDWGSLQSSLRKACFHVSSTLLTTTTTVTAMIVVLVIAAQLDSRAQELTWAEMLDTSVATGVFAVSVIYTIFQAAQVIQACIKMTPFINSLSLGCDIDAERLYEFNTFVSAPGVCLSGVA
jgi:hypothetical protein